MDETAYLGLGSNLGDRLATLQEAVDLLNAEPGIRVLASSRVWETDPVGGPEQPDFLNAVIRVETVLEPLQLLAACNRTEAALGRVRDVRWGPRTVDVDVLLIDGLTVDQPDAHRAASEDDRAGVRPPAAPRSGSRPPVARRHQGRRSASGTGRRGWRTPVRPSAGDMTRRSPRAAVCLRCDWEGKAPTSECPSCGAQLFPYRPSHGARPMPPGSGPVRAGARGAVRAEARGAVRACVRGTLRACAATRARSSRHGARTRRSSRAVRHGRGDPPRRLRARLAPARPPGFSRGFVIRTDRHARLRGGRGPRMVTPVAMAPRIGDRAPRASCA